MARLFFGMFVFTAVAAASGSLWAGDARSDQDIAKSIVDALREKQQAGELENVNIGVRVDNGDVWMDGNVATRKQQKIVLRVAQVTKGVRQVVNDIKVTAPEPVQPPAEKPRPAVAPASAELPLPFLPAYAAQPRPMSDAELRWQTEAKHTVDQIVKSIESKRDAGELEGFEVLVEAGFGKSFCLRGKVVNEQVGDTLLKILRAHAEVSSAHDYTKTVDEGTELPNTVTSHVSKSHPYRKVVLDWDDDWWMLDFKSNQPR